MGISVVIGGWRGAGIGNIGIWEGAGERLEGGKEWVFIKYEGLLRAGMGVTDKCGC